MSITSSTNILYKSGDITITENELTVYCYHCALQSIRQATLTSKASGKAKLLYSMVIVFVLAYELAYIQFLLPFVFILPHHPDNVFIDTLKSVFYFTTYALPIFALFAITTAGIRKYYHPYRLIIDNTGKDSRIEIKNPTPELIKCLDRLAPIRIPEIEDSNIKSWHLVAFFISTIAVSFGYYFLRFCNP